MVDQGISYEVDNDRSFRAALERASLTVQDLRISFGLISEDFYKSEQSIFKLQGTGQYPDYKNGGANSPYARAKMKKLNASSPYPLLVRSGALARSMLGPSNRGSIHKITNLSLTIGTSIWYGIFHQSDKPRKKIPLRKFVFIGPEAKQFATSAQMGRLERWNNILNDHVLRSIKKQGLGGA